MRHRIRSLINKETPSSVLSDDRIVDRLRDDGIEIARRKTIWFFVKKSLGCASVYFSPV